MLRINGLPIFLVTTILSSIAQGAIYGADDRRDINQVPMYRPQAAAVAVAVANIFVLTNPDGTFKIDGVEKLAGSAAVNACSDERFATQPIVGNCTGFLVGDRYLATAGHCLIPTGVVDDEVHPACEAFSWYFNFNLDSTGRTTEERIPSDQLYRCKRVVRAENIELPGSPLGKFGNDFALIELDRVVTSGGKPVTPLQISDRKVRVGEPVFKIGHPSGLPAKFAGFSPILATSSPFYFEVNLDSLGGDSGAPVFDLQKRILGILVSGHDVEYYEDPSGCYRVNTCDATGKTCDRNSKFEGMQTSNYIQYIGAMLPYLRKAQGVGGMTSNVR